MMHTSMGLIYIHNNFEFISEEKSWKIMQKSE